jgi:hypothetical protein
VPGVQDATRELFGETAIVAERRIRMLAPERRFLFVVRQRAAMPLARPSLPAPQLSRFSTQQLFDSAARAHEKF